MSDSFTEVTRTSWFGRIGRSLIGMVIGILLVIGMMFLLFWNEGRAVTTARSLAEGAKAVVSVAADRIDAANEGKLVHVTGPVTTTSTPSDTDFGISAPGIRLVRTVEMYQWTQQSKSETKKELGGSEETVTTYTYSKRWEDRAIDSSNFKQAAGHLNPPMEIQGRAFQVPDGKLVAFDLGQPVLDRIGGEQQLAIRSEQRAAVDAAYQGSARVSIADNRIYLGPDPGSPRIGDYRISYEVAPAGVTSIVARQSGSTFAGYQTVAGDELLMVRVGNVAADKMFADAVSENTLITWVIRAAGVILLFIGFLLLFSPLGVVGDVVPFIGSIVRFGTGLASFIMAILVGGTVIAIAWFWYRPMLSFAIFGGAALIAYLLSRMRRSKGPVVAQAPGPSAPAPAPVAPRAPSPPGEPTPPPAKPSGKIAW